MSMVCKALVEMNQNRISVGTSNKLTAILYEFVQVGRASSYIIEAIKDCVTERGICVYLFMTRETVTERVIYDS